MKTVKITVDGCDDYTEVTMQMTDAELAFLQKVAAAITNASEYGCMPRMEVKVVEEVPQ